MANRLDVVPVEVDDKSAVVVGVVVRAKPGITVVPAACGQRGAVKGIDGLTA
jgi:hypothetical protein